MAGSGSVPSMVWIPTCAGMTDFASASGFTFYLDSRLRGNDGLDFDVRFDLYFKSVMIVVPGRNRARF